MRSSRDSRAAAAPPNQSWTSMHNDNNAMMLDDKDHNDNDDDDDDDVDDDDLLQARNLRMRDQPSTSAAAAAAAAAARPPMMKPPLSSLIGNHASTTSGAGLITSGSAAQVAGARNLVNAAPAALPSHPNTTSHSNAQQPVGSNPAPALPAEQSDQVGLDYNASVDILCDFLEVAIHMILYARQLYPMESFERRKKFNVPVYMNRHPELNRYILDIVSSLRPWMEKRLVTRVAVNVVNPVDTSTDETAILERFVFEVQAATLPASRSVSLADIELMLRAVLIKISLCDALLQPVLAKDLETRSFSVCVFTRPEASGTIGMYKDHRLPWIMAEPRDAILANPFLHPLKSVHTGLLQMQLFVEERAVEEQHVGLDPGQAAMQT